MVDPVSAPGAYPIQMRLPSGEETLARAAHEARHLEQMDRSAPPERPPEPAAPVPASWPQPVPAEELGTRIDLIA